MKRGEVGGVDKYLHVLKTDAKETQDYLLKSVTTKTQQQLRLEEILGSLHLNPQTIADIACGAGGLSYHLHKLYPQARFLLADENDDALALAEHVRARIGATLVKADAHSLSLDSSSYDLVFFWHTLLCITNPRKAFDEVLRICKPGGRIFISSLFNVNHDVDLQISATDHTRASSRVGGVLGYNCFSERTIRTWTGHDLIFHDCEMQIDLQKTTRGLGTYTEKLEDGRRLQISGGILMNWKILEIVKS